MLKGKLMSPVKPGHCGIWKSWGSDIAEPGGLSEPMRSSKPFVGRDVEEPFGTPEALLELFDMPLGCYC